MIVIMDNYKKEVGIEYIRYEDYVDEIENSSNRYSTIIDKYPLGKLLLDYLDFDFDNIDKILEKYFNFDFPTSYDDLLPIFSRLVEGLDELVKIHPYFKAAYDDFILSLTDYSYSVRSYFEPITEMDRELDDYKVLLDPMNEEKLSQQTERIIEKRRMDLEKETNRMRYYFSYKNQNKGFEVHNEEYIHTFNDQDMHNYLKDYVNFCFIDCEYTEFKDLTPLERFRVIDFFNENISQRIFRALFTETESFYQIKDASNKNFEIENPSDRLLLAEIAKSGSQNLQFKYELDFDSAIKLEFLYMLANNIKIKKCEHCGEFFIPESREDEKYCSRVRANGRTCKQMGWEYKKKSKHYEEYRKVYVKFIAFKLRNLEKFNSDSYNITLDDIFDSWTKVAGYSMTDLDSDALTKEEYEKELENFIRWINISYKEIKRIVQGKISEEELDFLNSTDKKGMREWLGNL
ncbi:DUF6076 domain-containing protein [Gudongella oleilytica]|uniref:DUF6076 domain-containing protein n=1 Tax=Gudongella oleilytica TaxID=1582259 RepID=UPI002A365DBA|nr:DUF6076 domain-containing protein [Gudongella oleilytica]MDY0256784.1 DUF6076 domain-containing protein [Gudongella oleilytica]